MLSPKKVIRSLYQTIKKICPYNQCTVQIANYLSSNIKDCTIHKKEVLYFEKSYEPMQLLLNVDELLTIKRK